MTGTGRYASMRTQRPIKSVAKALDLLFAFTGDRPRGTVGELAAATGLPLSTTYRYLVTLRQRGLVEIDGMEGACRLSPRVLQLGEAVVADIDLVRRARPLMERLAKRTRETAQLVVRTGDRGTCLERAESPETLRVRPERGRSIPLHAGASMKAILAFLPAAEQDRILGKPLQRFTENTPNSPRALRLALQAIRRAGHAISFQEVYPGVRAVAVPIFDGGGAAVASLTIAGPGDRLTQRRARTLARDLRAAGRELTRQIGGAPPGGAAARPKRLRAGAGLAKGPAGRRRRAAGGGP
jgi:IclR family acetate operon transcriptional repressor